jgi:hypothetical protein
MEPVATPARRRWLRRIIFGVLVIAVVGVTIAALTPTWLSSSSGRAWLLERVSAEIPGTLSAAGMDLNWSDGQKLESLRLEDESGTTVARVRLVAADVTLAQILRGDYGTGRILIEGLELDLVLDDNGKLNLAGAISAPDAEKPKPIDLPKLLREFALELPPSLTADIELRDARISLRGPTLPQAFELQDVTGTLRLERVGAPIEFDLSGTLHDGSSATIQARLEGFDDQGRLRASGARLALSLKAKMAESAEAMRSLLGPEVRLDVRVETSASGASFGVEVESAQLAVKTRGAVTVAQDAAPRVSLLDGTNLSYTLTTALLSRIAVKDAQVVLGGDVVVNLAIDSLATSLNWPLDGSTFALESHLTIGDGRVHVRAAGLDESLAWSGWRTAIRKPVEGEDGSVVLQGRIDEGEVDVEGVLRLPDSGRLSARIIKLPLARIDRVLSSFTGRSGLLVDALGPTFDLECKIEKPEGGATQIGLHVETERLKLDAHFDADRNRDLLSARDVTLEYTMPRSLAPQLQLEKDLPVRLNIASFAIPLSGFDAARVSISGSAGAGPWHLGGETPLAIEWARFTVNSDALAEGVGIQANCQLEKGGFRASGQLKQLWDASGRLQLAKVRGRLEATLEDFPVARFEAGLGKFLGGRILLKGDGSDTTLDVQLKSDLLDVALPLVVSDGRVRLAKPGRVRYLLTPETIWHYAPTTVPYSQDAWTTARLPKPVELDVELLSMDAPADGSFALDDMRVNGSLSMGPTRIDRVPKAGIVFLTNWRVDFEGESLAAPQFVVNGSVGASRFPLGGPIEIVAKGGLDALELSATASDRLALTCAVVRDAESIRLREPARLDFELRRELLRKLELPDEWLLDPLRLGIVVENLRIPRDRGWSAGDGALRVTVPEARLRLEGRNVALRELTLSASAAEGVNAELTGKLDDATITVRAELAERRRGAVLSATAELLGMPTALFGNTARRAIGDTIDLRVNVDLPKGLDAVGGAVSATVRSEQLELDAELQRKQRWHLARPARIEWTATPEFVRAFLPDLELGLAAPAKLIFEITKLALPPNGSPLAGAALTAHARVPKLRLSGVDGKQLMVRDLTLDIDAADLLEPIRIGLDGALEGGAKTGRLGGTVVIDYLGDDKQPIVLSEERLAVTAKLDIEDLPTAAVDALFALDGYLPAVLGESATGELRADIKRGQGPVDVHLQSGNLQATVAGQLTRRSFLLRRPLSAKLTYSKRLADLVLPKLGPFFHGIVATEEPIRLQISHRGFRVPRQFDLAKVVMPHVMLDIGKVTMENQTLVKVIQQIAGARVPDQTTAWFTPVELSLRGGAVQYTKRLDILLEKSWHFSTWGKADLVRERVDMVLCIMPSTLKEILRIRGVDSADTLRVAMTGPLDNPRVNAARVATDLGAIRVKYDALRNLPALARPFAEGALKKLLSKTFQGPPPLPATVDPLPWLEQERK